MMFVSRSEAVDGSNWKDKCLDQNKTKSLWSDDLAQEYERANYGSGLSGRVMRRSHELVEVAFGEELHFPRVLEVGAGSGVHIRYV
jgi:phosphatidylethanolamine/phosphatidyl-N-methylethanolamine N-methyltransferase